MRRAARAVASVGGPVALATGGLAASSTISDRTKPKRQWERNGGRRDLGEGLAAWLLAIAGWDFIYYWNHRMMHEVRAMWAIHVVHHSSERYNLSTALRQPVADVFGVFVPYGLLARLGIRPRLIEQARGVNLLYQYWIHTDTIRRLGRGEAVLNTPSHHRVHHGSNPQYIDRNHGSILIVWDRLFGTFQREEEPVIYGLTKNIGTYNPGRIATTSTSTSSATSPAATTGATACRSCSGAPAGPTSGTAKPNWRQLSAHRPYNHRQFEWGSAQRRGVGRDRGVERGRAHEVARRRRRRRSGPRRWPTR